MPVDIGSIKRNDMVAGAAAVLAFIFSLIPGVRTGEIKDEFKEQAEASGIETSDNVNLWHGLGVLAVIVLLVGIAGLVVSIMNPSELQAVPVRWITAGLLAVATILAFIFMLTYDFDAPSGADASEVLDMAPGWSGWILLILGIVATVFAVLGALEEQGQPATGAAPAGGEPAPPAA